MIFDSLRIKKYNLVLFNLRLTFKFMGFFFQRRRFKCERKVLPQLSQKHTWLHPTTKAFRLKGNLFNPNIFFLHKDLFFFSFLLNCSSSHGSICSTKELNIIFYRGDERERRWHFYINYVLTRIIRDNLWDKLTSPSLYICSKGQNLLTKSSCLIPQSH